MRRLAVGTVVLIGLSLLHVAPLLCLPVLAYLIGWLFDQLRQPRHR